MQAAPKQPSHCLAANPDHEVQRIAVKKETRLLGKSKGVDKNLALACYEGSDYGLPSQSPKPRPHSSLPGRILTEAENTIRTLAQLNIQDMEQGDLLRRDEFHADQLVDLMRSGLQVLRRPVYAQ